MHLLQYLPAAVTLLGTVSAALRRAYSPPTYGSGNTTAVSTTTCNGESYIYEELAGYGFIASDARDKFGDTIGGIGSSIAVDGKSWRKLRNGSYTGLLWVRREVGEADT